MPVRIREAPSSFHPATFFFWYGVRLLHAITTGVKEETENTATNRIRLRQ